MFQAGSFCRTPFFLTIRMFILMLVRHFLNCRPPRSNGPAVPKAANVDLSRFKVLLAEEPAVKCIPRPLASVVFIDNHIDLLCRAIARCAISCRVRSLRTSGSRNMPWWSSYALPGRRFGKRTNCGLGINLTKINHRTVV